VKIFIARRNIELFRRLLLEESNEARRKTIQQLLEAEEKKLAELLKEAGKPEGEN